MFKKLFVLFIFILGLFLVSYRTVDRKTISNNLGSRTMPLDTLSINDGPYIFIAADSLIEKKIINGVLESNSLAFETLPSQFNAESSAYTNVSKIVALSDIHGQYEVTTTLLKNNKIIDASENWAYGDGHFVIVGDVFDRGPDVTELLWLLFKLEKQAEQAGGKVHYLLGNHEYMVMLNDLRYINKKYRQTERILRTHYNELYGNETVLGRWLRSKATIITINDNLFVHGGISAEFIESGFNLEATNQKLRRSLIENKRDKKWDSIYGKYYDSDSPLWYRGYFSDKFKKENIKKLLRALKVRHIVVGHTSQTQVESLFKNRVFAVDTSIKNGVSGELLFIESDHFYRGTMDGQKIKIEK
jgi:UDP-2,3-diacylglucosamine pyrophosphatase LpxH